jgi:glycine/D-amino acid oxidase-like deaminating enzyme
MEASPGLAPHRLAACFIAMERVFDIAVIGGGINGAGVVRDAAGRGLSVLRARDAAQRAADSGAGRGAAAGLLAARASARLACPRVAPPPAPLRC